MLKYLLLLLTYFSYVGAFHRYRKYRYYYYYFYNYNYYYNPYYTYNYYYYYQHYSQHINIHQSDTISAGEVAGIVLGSISAIFVFLIVGVTCIKKCKSTPRVTSQVIYVSPASSSETSVSLQRAQEKEKAPPDYTSACTSIDTLLAPPDYSSTCAPVDLPPTSPENSSALVPNNRPPSDTTYSAR